MRTKLFRICAMVLALAMCAALFAACKKDDGTEGGGGTQGGGGSEGGGTSASAFVYVPEYISLPDEMSEFDMSSINYFDGYIYFTRYIYPEYTGEEYPLPEAAPFTEGEAEENETRDEQSEDESTEDTDTEAADEQLSENEIAEAAKREMESYQPEIKLYKMSIDGKELTELEGFEPLKPDSGGDSYISKLTLDNDGNIWLAENVNNYHITDSGEYVNDGNEVYLRMLDDTGAELKKLDITAIIVDPDMEYYNSIGYMSIDKDNNIYASSGDSGVKVIGMDGNLLFALETADNNWLNGMVKLSDGRVGVALYENRGIAVKAIDAAAKAWGESVQISTNTYNLYDGNSEYDFYYYNESNLYGFDMASGTETKLLNWIGSDINSNNLNCFAPLSDGRVFCITRDWNTGDGKTELVILTKKDASEVEPRTILTMACIYLDYNLRGEIINFNKTNGKYRIEVNDYSQYNDYNSENEADWNAGITKLTTEIISGNVPDLLCTSELPIAQYAAKGLLEDLYPLIDSDPELSRDSFIESVLRALEIDGKLYQTASTFSVQTVVGDPRVIGPEPSWSIDDINGLLKSLPAGTQIFDSMTKDWMLQTICTIGLGDFVDWTTGRCSFDSEDFIKLLEFANSFPTEYEWTEDTPELPEQIQAGKVLATQYYAYDFQSIQMYKAMFGGEIVFKGFPSSSGNGNVLSVNSGIAMSSKCVDKEGAWQFMRMALTEEYQSSDNMWNFPTNKNAMNKMIEKAMERETYIDENGEEVEVSKGGWGWGSMSIDIYASSQEDVDMIMELIGSVKSIASYDTAMMAIITEEAAAYFSGSKSARDVANLIQSRVSIYVNEQR